MTFGKVALLLALAFLMTYTIDDGLARGIIWGAALIALGIVLSPAERAIYSINVGEHEETDRGS